MKRRKVTKQQVDRLRDDASPKVGAALKELRLLLGLTQIEVSELTGLGRTTITNMESGRFAVTLENMYAYVGALGLDVEIQFVEPSKTHPKLAIVKV